MQVSCGTFPPKTTWRRNWPRRPSQSWRSTSSSLCQAKKLMATSRRPLRQTSSTTPQDASGTPHLFVSSLCGSSMPLWLRCISSWLTWVWFPSHDHIFYMGTCSGSTRQLTGSGLVELQGFKLTILMIDYQNNISVNIFMRSLIVKPTIFSKYQYNVL